MPKNLQSSQSFLPTRLPSNQATNSHSKPTNTKQTGAPINQRALSNSYTQLPTFVAGVPRTPGPSDLPKTSVSSFLVRIGGISGGLQVGCETSENMFFQTQTSHMFDYICLSYTSIHPIFWRQKKSNPLLGEHQDVLTLFNRLMPKKRSKLATNSSSVTLAVCVKADSISCQRLEGSKEVNLSSTKYFGRVVIIPPWIRCLGVHFVPPWINSSFWKVCRSMMFVTKLSRKANAKSQSHLSTTHAADQSNFQNSNFLGKSTLLRLLSKPTEG